MGDQQGKARGSWGLGSWGLVEVSRSVGVAVLMVVEEAVVEREGGR